DPLTMTEVIERALNFMLAPSDHGRVQIKTPFPTKERKVHERDRAITHAARFRLVGSDRHRAGDLPIHPPTRAGENAAPAPHAAGEHLWRSLHRCCRLHPVDRLDDTGQYVGGALLHMGQRRQLYERGLFLDGQLHHDWSVRRSVSQPCPSRGGSAGGWGRYADVRLDHGTTDGSDPANARSGYVRSDMGQDRYASASSLLVQFGPESEPANREFGIDPYRASRTATRSISSGRLFLTLPTSGPTSHASMSPA